MEWMPKNLSSLEKDKKKSDFQKERGEKKRKKRTQYVFIIIRKLDEFQ